MGNIKWQWQWQCPEFQSTTCMLCQHQVNMNNSAQSTKVNDQVFIFWLPLIHIFIFRNSLIHRLLSFNLCRVLGILNIKLLSHYSHSLLRIASFSLQHFNWKKINNNKLTRSDVAIHLTLPYSTLLVEFSTRA